MKYKLLSFVFGVLLHSQSNAQVTEGILQASGLTCALCAKSIFTNLSALPFVESVDTDLNASSFLIKFKPNTNVDPQLLKKKVEDAGFFISDLQLKVKLINKAIGANTFIRESGSYYHLVNGKAENFSGLLTIQVIEKEYMTIKSFKKIAASYDLDCYQSAGLPDCKIPGTTDFGSNVYHVRTVK
jgi:copper chaperone CopZ